MVCAARLSKLLYDTDDILNKHYEILKIYGMPTKIKDMKLANHHLTNFAFLFIMTRKENLKQTDLLFVKKLEKQRQLM